MKNIKKYVLQTITAAAIAAGALFSANAADNYSPKDVAVRAAKLEGKTLSAEEINQKAKSFETFSPAEQKAFVGELEAAEKAKAKTNGGNAPKKGLNEAPTANIDSVLNTYKSKAKLDLTDAKIDSLVKVRKSLIKSPALDSLDQLVTKSNGMKASKNAEYSAKIGAITKARDELANATQKYLTATSSAYRKNADGISAYRDLARLLGYGVPENLTGNFNPQDITYTKKIQIKQNAKVDGIPGKETSVRLRADADQTIADLKNKMDSEINTIDTETKKYETDRKTIEAKVSAENKDKIEQLDISVAREYALAAENLFNLTKEEIKTGKRKDVAEQLLTATIGAYESAVKVKSNPQYEKRLAEIKRYEGKVEGIGGDIIDDALAKASELAKRAAELAKLSDYSARNIAKITTLGATAPYILVSDRIKLPSEKTHFNFGNYDAKLEGIANEIMLAMRIPMGEKISFLADGIYTPEGASADIDNKEIGKRSSDDFKINGGLEGNFEVVKDFRIGAKGSAGLDHYSQKVNRANEPGVNRELTRDNFLGMAELAMKYSGNKNFRTGFTMGYNSSGQFGESTKNGPAGSLGTDATDYMREFSGSIPFELTFADKVNVLVEPELGLRAYNFLENLVEGREFGWGGLLGINMDKWSIAGRGFNYPGSGYRGDIIASVAPFKDIPVTFTGAYGTSKLCNSETPDFTKENKGNEFALGVMFGGTIRDLYDRLKQIKVQPKKQ